MKKQILSFGLVASVVLLAGCQGSGTTYGTGVTHERQTMEGLSNIFALKPASGPDIDYNSRPDLVMPPTKETLPVPSETQTAAVEQDEAWPVSPEEKIAEVRAVADAQETDRGGKTLKPWDNPNRVFLKKPKRTKKPYKNLTQRTREEFFLANTRSQSEEAIRRREQLSYSTGVQRKYLTEPPKIYRTPSANAVAGEAGVTIDDIAGDKKEKEKNQHLIPLRK